MNKIPRFSQFLIIGVRPLDRVLKNPYLKPSSGGWGHQRLKKAICSGTPLTNSWSRDLSRVNQPRSDLPGGIHLDVCSACILSALSGPRGEFPRFSYSLCSFLSSATCIWHWSLWRNLTKTLQLRSALGLNYRWGKGLYLNFHATSSTYSPVKLKWM